MKRILGLFLAAPLFAHVGSPDVFFEGVAGPYRLLVTIRPPQVVPGIAEIEIRSASPGVSRVHIVPLRIAGIASQLAPVPDLAKPSREDSQFFTGSLWLMAAGSWKVRIDVEGDKGPGRLEVPVAALATRVLTMQKAEAFVLVPLALLLAVGIVSIVRASALEVRLEPGAKPDAGSIRRARIATVATSVIVITALYFGNQWWDLEANDYFRFVFKPLRLQASTQGSRLSLELTDPGWLNRRTDDLLPDHGHLMHLYVVRLPQFDRVWHLHPNRTGGSHFEQALPAMPAGRYALFGDVVHASGLPETATAQLDLPEIAGEPLTGDDAGGAPGGALHFEGPQGVIHARQPYEFRFRIDPPQDVELYMGMAGHAAFIKDDASVFAHVHPSGSVPMASLALVQPHAGHTMESMALPAEVVFPYGFPQPGDYRVVVQMKRAGHIETGIFPMKVEN